MSATIKLKSVARAVRRPYFDGLDLSGQRPWQMVPFDGEKFLLVVDGPPIGTIKSTDRSVVEAAVVPSRFQEPCVCVRGKSLGQARIIFNDKAGKEIGVLDVRVFPKIKRGVRFFLVSDNARHHTTVVDAKVYGWVKDTNHLILGPQANVFFEVKSVKRHQVHHDLGSPIKFADFTIYVPQSHKNWHDITDPGDVDAKIFNVFCVWDFTTSEGWAAFVAAKSRVTYQNMAAVGANANMCIMKDKVAYLSPEGIFAHEAVHYLSRLRVDHSEEKGRLMGDGETAPGRRLSREEIEVIHQWATKA
jgi:hypothetical protein